MESQTKTTFDELFQIEENNSCFECGAPSNFWASVNNGIFLCLNCSGAHRSLGVNVSFVRSITMDTWSLEQLEMMKHGGNTKLKEFFQKYNIPSDGPLEFKYKTRAAYYYREMLKALARNEPVADPPSLEDGLMLVDDKNPDYVPGQNVGFGTTPKEEEPLDKVFHFMEKAVENTISTTTKLVQNVSEKVNDPNFDLKQEAKELGTKVVTGAKSVAVKVGETVTDPEFQNQVKEIGSKVATGAKNVVTKIGETVTDPAFQNNIKEIGSKVADKSKEIWEHKEEYLSKGAELAKKGWSGMKGLFNKLTGNEPNRIDLREENLTTVYYQEIPHGSDNINGNGKQH